MRAPRGIFVVATGKKHGIARKRSQAAVEKASETEETVPKKKRQRKHAATSTDGNAVQVTGAAGIHYLKVDRLPAYGRVGVGRFTFATVTAVAPPPPPPGNTPSVSVDPSASSLVDGAAVPQTQIWVAGDGWCGCG
jgi:hypothetical protein